MVTLFEMTPADAAANRIPCVQRTDMAAADWVRRIDQQVQLLNGKLMTKIRV